MLLRRSHADARNAESAMSSVCPIFHEVSILPKASEVMEFPTSKLEPRKLKDFQFHFVLIYDIVLFQMPSS